MKMKKLIAVILAVSLMLALASTAYAADSEFISGVKTSVSQVLGAVELQKDLFGLADVDFDALALGVEIPAYELTSEGLINNGDIHYFPIIFGGDWVATAVVTCDADGNMRADVSTQYVDNYEALNAEADDEIALIFDSTKVYLYCGGELAEVSEHPVTEGRISVNDYSGTIAPSAVALSAQSALTIARPMARSANEVVSLNVPQVTQPTGTNACWAASLVSILGYYGISTTISDIYSKAGLTPYAAASVGKSAGVIAANYGNVLSYGRGGTNNVFYDNATYTLGMNEIKMEVGTFSSPLFAGFEPENDEDTSPGHAVVIQGYVSYGTTNNISYMDPDNGTYHMTSAATNGEVSIVFNGNTLVFESGFAVYD